MNAAARMAAASATTVARCLIRGPIALPSHNVTAPTALSASSIVSDLRSALALTPNLGEHCPEGCELLRIDFGS
ncbi:MAG: hypothetical protein ACJAYU_003320 [Bradymonadia bacterium]|jgi:hypothetical protein